MGVTGPELTGSRDLLMRLSERPSKLCDSMFRGLMGPKTSNTSKPGNTMYPMFLIELGAPSQEVSTRKDRKRISYRQPTPTSTRLQR